MDVEGVQREREIERERNRERGEDEGEGARGCFNVCFDFKKRRIDTDDDISLVED